MKIFLTGASGFVGGAIGKRLAKDHWVLALARSPKSIAKVQALGLRPIAGSLETIESAALKECDLVIHCAAFVEPWGTLAEFEKVNVEGTKRLLEMAKKAGVRRFIHISTEAALFYGQDMVDIDESYPYPSYSPFPYSETKRRAEILVRQANVPGELETICLRPRLVWGPGDETILANLIEMVDAGRYRWIDGGKWKTSTCHIDNLVEATVLAMDRGQGGAAYFITDGEVNTMRDFLTGLLATAHRDPGSKSVPSWLVRFLAQAFEAIWRLFRIKKKPPITRFSAAIMSSHCTISSNAAQSDLGYVPLVSVKDGLAKLSAGK